MESQGHGLPNSPDKRQFSIKSCLGRGGFGEVYRASMTNATGLETEVAVKLLHHDLEHDSQAVQRLRDEGRMLGALVHPSILRIYDFVVLDSRVGLVMEYVEGQDLAKCIRGENTMPPRAVVAVFGRVSDALRAAWNSLAPGTESPLHLIHRDIKPQNIRIGTQGDVKLLDFGVARASNVGREAQTNTGHMVGSYLYMAPECLLENSFSQASDIFALGVTLYESLAHKRLFKDHSLRELYVKVLREDEYSEYITEALDELDAPEPILEMLRQMLDRDPAKRPDASEISARCEDLTEILPGPTLRRWCKNRTWPAVNEVEGMLDGRTITEATMAAGLMPDLGQAQPTGSRRRLDWSMVFGTVGTIGMLFGIAFAILGMGTVGLALALRGSVGRAIDQTTYTPTMRKIPSYRGQLRPKRTETGRAKVAPDGTTVPMPAPRQKTILNLDTDFQLRLYKSGRTYRHLDRVGPGTYTIQVDWGGGYSRIGTVRVSSGRRNVTVTCNRFKRTCDVQ